MAEGKEYYVVQLDDERLCIVSSSALTSTSIQSIELKIDGKEYRGRVLFKGSKSQCLRRIQMIQVISKAVSIIDMRNDDSDDQNKTLVPGNTEGETREKEKERRKKIIVQVLLSLLTGNDDDDGNPNVHAASCDGCGRRSIQGDRYKCLVCTDYDLCGFCFERGKETEQHKSGHSFAHFKIPGELFGEPVKDVNAEVTLSTLRQRFVDERHPEDIVCEGCLRWIIGLRFKCDICRNYNLCLSCMEKRVMTKTHQVTHSLIVIPKDVFPRILMEDIQLGHELGKGAFGAVYKAKWISKNLDVACKMITLPSDEKKAQTLEKSFRKELAAYAELSGPYILKTYGYGEEILPDGTKRLMLVMEYMARGSLRHVLQSKEKLSIRRKLDMACDIASGMRKLHAHQMIHRDIRPDNILVDESYNATIGDMGIARDYEPSAAMTQIGCQRFMPPEFFYTKYDQSLDVFTFGLTLNELFTETDHKMGFDERIMIPVIVRQEKSVVFEELIERCLARNPKVRPSAIEIETTLHLYRQAFFKLVTRKYIKMNTEEKNKVFLEFYEEFHPQAKAQLAQRFPPLTPTDEDPEDTEPLNLKLNPALQALVMLLGRLR